MENAVTIADGELRLCSGLDEYAFGKTNYNTIVTQTGILATCDSAASEELHFSYEKWSFTDIKSFKTPENDQALVFYCNKNPLSTKAQSLYQLFKKSGQENSGTEDKNNMFQASLAVTAFLTQAAREEIEIPLNGSGGILVDGFENSNKASQKLRLLFLPHNLFVYSLAAFPALEQADLHNCWINPTLNGLPGICFLRSCLAYKMLTGRYPYPSADNLTRNADLLDKNFLPLELSVNGINPQLAEAVNTGLKLNSNSVSIPGKKSKGKKSEELQPQKDFPLELLAKAKENISSNISDKDFEEKVKSYKKLMSSRVKTKRTIRRNTTTIGLCLIALVFAILYGRSTYKNYLDDYTTKGLTSTQTIQAYFKGMNNMDVALLQNFVSGRNANRYLDSISNVYVISKQRSSSDGRDSGYLKPAKFFVMLTNPKMLSLIGLYGASNIRVDNKQINEYIELQKNKDAPQIITQEGGVSVTKGDKSVHSVEYYTLHTEGSNNDIYVSKNKGSFTLTFKKNKWIITDIDLTEEEVNFDSDAFKKEYFDCLAANDNDIVKTIKELSLKYDFLPGENELKIEKKAYEEYLADPFYGLF